MKKKILNELNPKQVKLMTKVRAEWLDRFFSCELKTDRKKATKYINWLYSLCGYEKPMIIFLSSPLGAQYGANILKNGLGDQVYDQVSGQVRGQVYDQVSDQVSDQVRGQVYGQVYDQVYGQVSDQKMEYFGFCSYGSVWDYGWVAFYDFFTRIGIIDHEKFNNFLFLMKSGVYDMIQFEKICIVSDMPTDIHRDKENRLHNQSDFAIKWADGYGQYWIHGVSVSEKVVKTPEKLTKKDWSNETNMERRRIIQDQMPDFVKKIGGKEIQKDSFGTLLEIELPSDPEKIARYVKVKDASTEREYYLRVPPMVRTCKEGVGWTFNFTEDQYNPEQQT